MELNEKKVRGRLDSIDITYYKLEGKEKEEADEEITFLRRLLRYCDKDFNPLA